LATRLSALCLQTPSPRFKTPWISQRISSNGRGGRPISNATRTTGLRFHFFLFVSHCLKGIPKPASGLYLQPGQLPPPTTNTTLGLLVEQTQTSATAIPIALKTAYGSTTARCVCRRASLHARTRFYFAVTTPSGRHTNQCCLCVLGPVGGALATTHIPRCRIDAVIADTTKTRRSTSANKAGKPEHTIP